MKSLDTGVVPGSWKQAHVNSVYKKGTQSLLQHYSAIGLTSVIGKMIESILADSITDYFIAIIYVMTHSMGLLKEFRALRKFFLLQFSPNIAFLFLT